MTGLFPTQSGNTVIVGVSGGPDSVALFHLLCSGLPAWKFIAVYVDHGLRPGETTAESALVKNLAHSLQASFEHRDVDVNAFARQHKRSIEDAARHLRYQTLEEICDLHQGNLIAVAHTADDQAEEILIRLLRGCGRKRLAGMLAHNGRIIRPLLQESKESLLHYLQSQKIPFCIDSSNLERTFLRNRVRLDLLPFLEQHFNPAIRQTLLQTSQILTDEEALLDQLTNAAWQEVVSVKETVLVLPSTPACHLQISTSSFCDCHIAIQRRILEKCCLYMEEQPQFNQIALLLELLHQGAGGAEIHLNRGLRARKQGGTVIISYPSGKGIFRGRL